MVGCFVPGCTEGYNGHTSHLFKAPTAANKKLWLKNIPKKDLTTPFDFERSKICYLHFKENYIKKNSYSFPIVVNGKSVLVENPSRPKWTLTPDAVPTIFCYEKVRKYNATKRNLRKHKSNSTDPSKPKLITKASSPRKIAKVSTLTPGKIAQTANSSKEIKVLKSNSTSCKNSLLRNDANINDHFLQDHDDRNCTRIDTVKEAEAEFISDEIRDSPGSPESALESESLGSNQELERNTAHITTLLGFNPESIHLPSKQWVMQSYDVDNCPRIFFHQIVEAVGAHGFVVKKSVVVNNSDKIQIIADGKKISQNFLQTNIKNVQDLNRLLLEVHTTTSSRSSELQKTEKQNFLDFDSRNEFSYHSDSELSEAINSNAPGKSSAVEVERLAESELGPADRSLLTQEQYEVFKKKYKLKELSVKLIKLSLPTKRKSLSLIVKRLPSGIVGEQQFLRSYKKPKKPESFAKLSKYLFREGDTDPVRLMRPLPVITSKLKCSICEEEFLFYREYAKHKRSAHRPKTYLCEHCGADVKINCYWGHMQKHKKEQSRDHDQQLEKKQQANEEKKHVCLICGSRFRTLHFLNRHCSDTHTVFIKKPRDLPLYECSVCKKVFRIKRYLELHERGHLGEFKFKCDRCKFGTSIKSLLDRHKQAFHPSVPIIHECDICHLKLKRKYNVHLHKKLCHSTPKEKEYFKSGLWKKGALCTICGLPFTSWYCLKKHIKFKHKDIIEEKQVQDVLSV